MKRTLTYLVALFAAGLNSNAAGPTVDWVFHAGGSKHDKIRALTVDQLGNTFVTGEFSDTARFGETAVKTQGGLDFVLAKLNSKGRLVWVTTAGGGKIDRGYAVAVDAGGNSYVTGHFQSDTIAFGNTVLTNRGDYDVFVAKYNPSGKPLWARSAGGPAYDFGHGIGVDPKGGVFVSGMVRGEADFGSEASAGGPGMGPFVARYTAAGESAWVWQMRGKGSGSGHELCVDQGGNVYVGGFFAGSGKLGPSTVKSSKGRDIFAAKLTRSGEFKWAFQAGGAADGLVSGMAADKSGNCFISGMFKATAKFGDQSFTSAGDNDFYVAKLDDDGKAKWAVHAGGPSIDYGLGLAVDGDGNALLTGETTGEVKLADHQFRKIGKRDLYAAKFSPDGKLLWAWQAGGKLNSLSYAAGCGPEGLSVIAGAFSGDIRLGADNYTSRGANDIIVVGLRD